MAIPTQGGIGFLASFDSNEQTTLPKKTFFLGVFFLPNGIKRSMMIVYMQKQNGRSLMHRKKYYVYIVTNYSRTVLYTGVTNNLEQRVIEHYLGRGNPQTFTGKYHR